MRRGIIKVISAILAVSSLASYKLNIPTRADLAAESAAVQIMAKSAATSKRSSCAEVFAESEASEAFYVGEAEISDSEESDSSEAVSDNVKVGSRFWELLFGKETPKTLIASGDVFGIKMRDLYPCIVDAPRVPALRAGDRIISVNGREVHSAEEVKSLIGSSGGESVTICAMRGDTTFKLEVVPKPEEGEYRLGITLKDMTAGIGTITFIDPESGSFGGLGHGICDSESGAVIEMREGFATEVVLGGIHKGAVGTPGELSGIMTDKTLGRLRCNTEVGVFGEISGNDFESYGKLLEVGKRSDVSEGEATIISTVKNGKKAEYKIEIYDVDEGSLGSKSFRIRVTDPALIAITGGIVRGMSGSPIVQNGKLVGAVTHVLVADPTEGYGIFIENMLSHQNSDAQPKAA